MKKLLVALCLGMSFTSVSVQAAPPVVQRDHRVAGKIATHLPSKEGEVPTEDVFWSWHSDRSVVICEEGGRGIATHLPWLDVACAYWTGHAERRQK